MSTMLSGLGLLTGAYRAEFARLRDRTIIAAICYGVAAVVFGGAIGLGGAAGVVAMVERFGLVAGLGLSGLILAMVGIVALIFNSVHRRHIRRRAMREASVRSTIASQSASVGMNPSSGTVAALLPAAAILSFTVASALLKNRRA